jgi:CDP-glycerol glycerophosphotransferase (TagB/SpsB family)
VARLRQELGLPSGTTAVLYAPTHRDWEKGYQPRLHLEDLCRRLGPDVVVLVRSHYFYRGARVAPDVASQVRDVSHHASIEELCLASDLLVTDYSSIQFDYANLGRPIVIFADDYQTYRDVRGTYFDLLAEPPGAVATTQAQLTEILGSGSYAAPEHAARLHTFRDRFCEFDDGHAAERVVRRMFLGEEVPLPIVPLAQRSPAPAPSDRAVLEVLAALAEAG